MATAFLTNTGHPSTIIKLKKKIIYTDLYILRTMRNPQVFGIDREGRREDKKVSLETKPTVVKVKQLEKLNK